MTAGRASLPKLPIYARWPWRIAQPVAGGINDLGDDAAGGDLEGVGGIKPGHVDIACSVHGDATGAIKRIAPPVAGCVDDLCDDLRRSRRNRGKEKQNAHGGVHSEGGSLLLRQDTACDHTVMRFRSFCVSGMMPFPRCETANAVPNLDSRPAR